jgi:hypothetical protein
VEIANCGVVANVEGNRELPMSFIVFDASSWNDAIRLSCSGGMARTVCASKQMIERYTIKFGPRRRSITLEPTTSPPKPRHRASPGRTRLAFRNSPEQSDMCFDARS